MPLKTELFHGPSSILLWRIDVFCPPHPDHPKGQGWYTFCDVPYYASEQAIQAFKDMTDTCPFHGWDLLLIETRRVVVSDPGDKDYGPPEDA